MCKHLNDTHKLKDIFTLVINSSVIKAEPSPSIEKVITRLSEHGEDSKIMVNTCDVANVHIEYRNSQIML